MKCQGASAAVALFVIATQVLGPAAVWAAETQRDVLLEPGRRLAVTGLHGDELKAAGAEGGSAPRTLRFAETVAYGDTLTVGRGTTAEVLIGNRALVTVQGPATFRITEDRESR